SERRGPRTRDSRREAWRSGIATTSHRGRLARRTGPRTAWRSDTATTSRLDRLANTASHATNAATTRARTRRATTMTHRARARTATRATSRATTRTVTTVTPHPATAAVPREPIRMVGATVTEDRAASAGTRPPSAAHAHVGGSRDLPHRFRLIRARPGRGSQCHSLDRLRGARRRAERPGSLLASPRPAPAARRHGGGVATCAGSDRAP